MLNEIAIGVPANFAFEVTVESHGWYLLAPFRWDRRRRLLSRPELFGDEAVDLEIRCRRNRLIISSPDDLSDHLDSLVTRIARMFQLRIDTAPFLALCERRRSHRQVAERRMGRLLCGSTLFEDAVKIIATTNTTWRQTVRMVDLLVEQCGSAAPSGRKSFPSPAAISAAGAEILRSACRFGYRSNYLAALAEGIVRKEIDLDTFADASLETPELFGRFRSLPGIGPYGAAHLLAMEGRHDFIAVDTEFRRFVRQQHFSGREVDDRMLVARYEKWGRWKYLGYWSELWLSVADEVRGREEPK